jgi:hypothetical protein
VYTFCDNAYETAKIKTAAPSIIATTHTVLASARSRTEIARRNKLFVCKDDCDCF